MLLTRRHAAFTLTAALAACGRPEDNAVDAPERGSLAWAIDGEWRIEPERDSWRHPTQTLLFWGLEGDMTVLEVLPGRGWYTSILAPYLAANGGHLIAASFDPNSGSMAQRETLADWEARFTHDPRLFGRIERTVVGAAGPLAPAASVDLAIIANTVNTLMAQGVAERVFDEVFTALKPGGAFGVEQHRASSTGLQDPLAGTGYVQEAYVKQLAQEAGFEFVAASDVNANPRDTRDHPFGVWTLPPTLRTSPLGRPDNPDFDSGPYMAVGESDRMTLKFRKPTGPVPAAAPSAP
ncbi:class I SAM-dependent methyltransferase [Terricaulis sp.]|uniref:class I SAM-dependent methyltransferase n=1 Tax=Terricaulis sp. TaxID=2768686 RepID=UPI0037832410